MLQWKPKIYKQKLIVVLGNILLIASIVNKSFQTDNGMPSIYIEETLLQHAF